MTRAEPENGEDEGVTGTDIFHSQYDNLFVFLLHSVFSISFLLILYLNMRTFSFEVLHVFDVY